MSLFAKKTKERSLLIAVIESGSVHLGLALLAPQKQPLIVYTTTHDIPFQENIAADRLTTLMLQTLSAACAKFIREGAPHVMSRSLRHGRIDELHVVYASPWHVSQTKTISVRHETPFTFTPTLLREIVNKETHASSSTEDVFLIEERVTNIRLNGYAVSEPYGKETSEVTLSLFTSAISTSFKTTVEEVFMRFVTPKHTVHHSLPLVLFSGIRDLFAAGKDFLIVSIGDELTDIAYTKNDSLAETVSFPVGRTTLVRSLMTTLVVPHEEALSLMKKTHLSALDTGSRSKTEQGVGTAVALFADAFRGALTSILPADDVPDTTFLFADDEGESLMSVISYAGKPAAMGQSAATDVRRITPSLLAPFYTRGGGAKHIEPSVICTALYADKIDEHA